ncbi:branched-chain amino acid transport system permease protein [Rhodoligotrophos appendicifer]|uniref:branched-chain amino acid ABC transporter permease n=1 Tax=Rhodoligotrophos appendicifer TaxID=987056 RepID=UPI0011869D88|nr:branched-chain amino acid ABC transporter permease [Rhodoligotrophos appendicifer]
MYRACGSFSETYTDDMSLIRTRMQWLLLIAGLIALLLPPVVLPLDWLRFMTITGITIIAVLGLQILVGISGQVSVGQSAFMGIGGYFAAVAATKLQLPFPAALAIGAFGAAGVGVIFGLPAARIKGFYLALTTLAAQFVFEFSVVRLPDEWFGGAAGIPVAPPVIFGHRIDDTVSFYFFVLPFVIAATFVALFILRSRVGRAFIAVRDNDLAAEVTGIPVTRYKVLAFGVASFFAGLAGALLAYENRLVHFEQFTLFQSIWFLGMLIVGGMGSILGAVLGTIALRLVQESLTIVGPQLATYLPGSRLDIAFPMVNVVLGATIILFLVYQPRGLAHLYRKAERFFRLWPFPH